MVTITVSHTHTHTHPLSHTNELLFSTSLSKRISLVPLAHTITNVFGATTVIVVGVLGVGGEDEAVCRPS